MVTAFVNRHVEKGRERQKGYYVFKGTARSVELVCLEHGGDCDVRD